MARFGVIAVFGLLALGAFGPANAVDQYAGRLSVDVGRTLVVDTPDVDRVALGTGGLVDVRAFPEIGEILLIGRESGVTDLRIWDTDGNDTRYRLKVGAAASESEPRVRAEELSKLFQGASGIRVVKLGEQGVAITGQATRQIDYKRASTLASQFSEVTNQVKQPKLTRKATILIEARVLEVARNNLDKIGINWGNSLNGPIFAWLSDWDTNSVFRPSLPDSLQLTGGGGSLPSDVGSNTFAGWAGSWESTINLLREDGVAKVLAKPKLTTISGQSASFQSGGEVPVQTVNDEGEASITYRDFGVSLDIEPRANANGLIRTKLKVEVSALDDSIAINGQPGLTTRSTETVMNGREGRSMVISGLFNQQKSKDVDAVPGLGSIPVIGELFKSRTFRDQRTELVIIVTPYLVTPDSPRMKKMKNKASDLKQEAKNELEYSIYD